MILTLKIFIVTLNVIKILILQIYFFCNKFINSMQLINENFYFILTNIDINKSLQNNFLF